MEKSFTIQDCSLSFPKRFDKYPFPIPTLFRIHDAETTLLTTPILKFLRLLHPIAENDDFLLEIMRITSSSSSYAPEFSAMNRRAES